MSLFTQFTGSNGPYPTPRQFVFQSSTVYIAPANTWLLFTVIGGGGGGGLAGTLSSLYGRGIGAGGGAGGCAYKKVYTTAETTFTITVGAAGAGRYVNSFSSFTLFGFSGGISSVSSSVANITAFGGGGGRATTDTGSTTLGGVGGTATGGDISLTGGRGGNIGSLSITIPTNTVSIGTGGGAVNLFLSSGSGAADELTRGGDFVNQTVATNSITFATGGGGIGGRGGDRGSGGVSGATGGGGSGGQATDNSTTGGTNSIPQYFAPGSNIISFVQNIPGYFISGVGRNGNQFLTGEPGAATGGANATENVSTISAGLFAGSGAQAAFGGTYGNTGSAIVGGGGGGVGRGRNNNAIGSSGSGGKGIIFLQIMGS